MESIYDYRVKDNVEQATQKLKREMDFVINWVAFLQNLYLDEKENLADHL